MNLNYLHGAEILNVEINLKVGPRSVKPLVILEETQVKKHIHFKRLLSYQNVWDAHGKKKS